MGGNFNCLMNLLSDRFPSAAQFASPRAKHIADLCEELGYVDVWRTLHPADKEYTFFSNPHKCYSRIDYFFTPKTMLKSVVSSKTGNIVISDHAAVYLDVEPKMARGQSWHWRLNPFILKDHKFVDYFISEFKAFLSLNSPLANSPSLLWENSKAYARRLIISYIASKKRKIAEQQKVLEIRHTIAEKEYIRKPTGSKLKEIAAIRCTLNSLLTQTATDKLRFAKQKLFEHGDKPGKYLAYLTKKLLASTPLPHLWMEQGFVLPTLK